MSFLKDFPIVSRETAERCQAVVCMPATEPLLLNDNHTSACFECGVQVQFRPDVPVSPPKICVECFAALMDDRADNPPTFARLS